MAKESDVLAKIMAHKRGEIEQAISRRSAEELAAQLADAPPVRDFVASLKSAPSIGLIAEVKKASPSAGLIREDFDPVEIARIYEANGAACLSVLTDEHFFQGHLNYLKAVRDTVSIPVMRKEFILDRYQILEARVAGADCCLLIAECLDEEELEDLYGYTRELGMHALIEIYEPDNLNRVLALNPPMLGINNRNLRTFMTSLSHTTDLIEHVPEGTLLVSESGIHSADDVAMLHSAGVQAILVGETLMRSDDIGAKVREILSN